MQPCTLVLDQNVPKCCSNGRTTLDVFRHYTGVTWVSMILKSPARRLFVRQLVQSNSTWIPEMFQLYWPFVRVINRWHRWSKDSHHKGPMTRKAFPCHDFIMGNWFQSARSPTKCFPFPGRRSYVVKLLMTDWRMLDTIIPKFSTKIHNSIKDIDSISRCFLLWGCPEGFLFCVIQACRNFVALARDKQTEANLSEHCFSSYLYTVKNLLEWYFT